MVRAIKGSTVVGPEGRVVIDHSELPEGSSAEVIVLVDDQTLDVSQAPRSLSSYVGAMQGQFRSADDADAYVRKLRDEWDRP